MGVDIQFDMQAIRGLEQAAVKAAKTVMEQVQTDIESSGTMPYDIGIMQNNETFVDADENGARLVTGSPQARRLYYHPEYKFQQGHNTHAGGKWTEPYISGDKKDFVRDTFAEIYEKEAGT